MSPSIGPMELVIIALVCLIGLAIIAGITALAIYMRRQPRANAAAMGSNCSNCGKPTVAGAPFCPHCGSRISQPPPDSPAP